MSTDDETSEAAAILPRLVSRAAALLAGPLRPPSDQPQGYFEIITANQNGQIWFIGWMKQPHPTEFSALIVERVRIPCGIALLTFDRDDLAPGACGVVGLIAAEWYPNAATEEFLICFGAAGELPLRTHRPLRVTTIAGFMAEFEQLRPRCHRSPRNAGLLRLINRLEHWTPSAVATQGFAAYAAADQLLLIPGFGCLAEGWIVSPAKRMEHLRLRIGHKTLRCASETLYRKPRADLLEMFPGHDLAVAQAGFVACFVGDLTAEDVSAPTLKIVFEDGSAWNQPLAPEALRQLGHSASVDGLRRFYPAVEDEVFFPRLADTLRRRTGGAMLRPVAVARAARVVIFTLPPDRCDLILLFADIAERVASLPPDHAVALVASASASRADTVRLFADLSRLAPRTGLFFADPAGQPLDLLIPILAATQAERFLFVGPAVFLSARGWWAALRELAQPDPRLAFFDVSAEAWQTQADEDIPASLCFAWSAAAAQTWHRAAPLLLGFYRDNGLTRGEALPPTRYHDAARLTRKPEPGLLETAINALAPEWQDA